MKGQVDGRDKHIAGDQIRRGGFSEVRVGRSEDGTVIAFNAPFGESEANRRISSCDAVVLQKPFGER